MITVTIGNVTPESRAKLTILHKALKRSIGELFNEMVSDSWEKYKDVSTENIPSRKIEELTEAITKIYTEPVPYRRKNARRQSNSAHRRDRELWPEIRRDVPPVPLPKSNPDIQ